MSIEPKWHEGIERYVSSNMSLMEGFGSVDVNKSSHIMGDFEKNVFYWLHVNHWHTMSIGHIKQDAQNKLYNNFTAEQMIASMRYLVENPEFRKEIAEKKRRNCLPTPKIVARVAKHYNISRNRVRQTRLGFIEVLDEDRAPAVIEIIKHNGDSKEVIKGV